MKLGSKYFLGNTNESNFRPELKLVFVVVVLSQESSLDSKLDFHRTLSFEEQRLETDQFWKHFRKLDGGQSDRNKERKPDKKQRTSDSSELWARAFDYDNMDYLTEQEADFDHYDEFYDDAVGYELFDGEDEDEYEEEEDEDDDDGEDIEDRAARICEGLRNAKEKNVLKLIMTGDKSKTQSTKQTEKEPLKTATSTTSTKSKHSNEDKDKFLLGTNL